jgi:hypothetical protein
MQPRASRRYEQDFYGWTQDQAAKLRRAADSRVNLSDPIDLANLAEEIESLGASQLRELYSRYLMLLVHLLKWQHQPVKRTPSWRGTINTQRREIADLLSISPGLKPRRRARLAKAYQAAREDAAEETGLPVERFPEACPYALGQVESRTWWPAD